MTEPANFMFNVHFKGHDDREFSQSVTVATDSAERALEIARARLTELGRSTIAQELVEMVPGRSRSEGVKRVSNRWYFSGGNAHYKGVPMPEWEPTEALDEEKLRRTLWAIVECIVNRDLSRLPELCHLHEGMSSADYFNEVYTYPARLIMPPDDRLETLADREIGAIGHTDPQKWHLWGCLYSEEEGRSDLMYIIDLWEGGRDLYEAELGGIYVP